MTKLLEAHVKAKVKVALNTAGGFYWMPSAGGYGISGVADFCAIYKGRFIAIETKVGKRKPTKLQERFLATVREHGGYALVINENNVHQLTELLHAIDTATTDTRRRADEELAACLRRSSESEGIDPGQ